MDVMETEATDMTAGAETTDMIIDTKGAEGAFCSPRISDYSFKKGGDKTWQHLIEAKDWPRDFFGVA